MNNRPTLKRALHAARTRLGSMQAHRQTGPRDPQVGEVPMTTEAAMFPEDRWFADHIEAARDVIRTLDAYGSPLKGHRVADVGTGDGIIALGLAIESGIDELVAYDLNPTDVDHLLELSRSNQYADELPENLRFEASMPDRVPADDGAFDAIVSWSCFEHVSEPGAMARELRRIVADDGVLFLQLWPFYFSEHGSHLFDWYQGGFPHLTLTAEQIHARLFTEELKPQSDYIWGEYQMLNKITLDDLGAALSQADFRIVQAELMSAPTTLPESVSDLPLSQLLISGIKLVARPRPRRS